MPAHFPRVVATLVLAASGLAGSLPAEGLGTAAGIHPDFGSRAPGGRGYSATTLPDDPPPLEIAELRMELERIILSTGTRGGKWAVLAVSLDRGDTLLALNPLEPMVPASNQKLLTTAAALHFLGPDFRYETFLLTDGAVEGEVLRGDLVLFGTGDPSLSRRFFPGETAPMDSLAQRLYEAGIRDVQGNLVVDGSYFSGPELHPDWDPRDLNEPFAAPVSAVSFNENLVSLRVEAGPSTRLQPTIHTLPPGSGLPVVNTAITTSPGTRSRIWLFRETPSDPIGIEGEIPLGGRDVWRELPVPDPLDFSGHFLLQALEKRGIRVSGEIRTVRDPHRSVLPPDDGTGTEVRRRTRILGRYTSPPLLEILRFVNKESNNFLAETVLKTMGRQVSGEGSFEGGTRAVVRFLTEAVGIPAGEVQPRDGSGLSAQNHVSANALVRVLAFMADSPTWLEFWGTLPEAGVRRELGRMVGSPAARNLRAKTGTMDGVSALSGMVRTRSGERVLFSIISNGVSSERRAKRAEDQLGIRLASLTRTPTASAVSDTEGPPSS